MLHWTSQLEEEAGMSQPQSHAEITRGFEAKHPAVGRPSLSRAPCGGVPCHAVPFCPRDTHTSPGLPLLCGKMGRELKQGWDGIKWPNPASSPGAGTLPTASVRVCRGARGAGGAARCLRHLREGDGGDLPPEDVLFKGWQWPTGVGFSLVV